MDENKLQIEQSNRTNNFYYQETVEKENFKLLADIMSIKIQNGDIRSICDIGCATGELLGYLMRRFGVKNIKYCGVDINEQFVKCCETKFKDGKFVVGNIYTGCDLKEKFDSVLFFGTLCYFSDFKRIFNNLFSLLNERGYVYIFSPFNRYDYHVKYEYDYMDVDGEKIVNVEHTHSIKEISNWLEEKNIVYKWHYFQMPFDIQRSKANYPVRVWTERMADGSRINRDAIDRIQEQYLLELKL